MIGRDLGRAATLVASFHRSVDDAYEEAHAFGAPSECFPLIRAGHCRAFRRIRRRVKAITGLPWRVYTREIERRTTKKFAYTSNACREPDGHGGRNP